MNLVRRLRNGLRLLQALGTQWRHGLPAVDLEALLPDKITIQPPVLDDICLPPHYGPRDHDDYRPLMALAAALEPSVILELGTAHGNTVANLCRHCPDATVYTVNARPEEISGEIITFQLTTEDIGRVYRKAGFAQRVVQILANTLTMELGEYLQRGSVDLAIIDGCHDTSYVINDFEKVRPFVRKGGLVLFHDTHPSLRGHLVGSTLACMKLRREGYDIKHVRHSWWGLWQNN